MRDGRRVRAADITDDGGGKKRRGGVVAGGCDNHGDNGWLAAPIARRKGRGAGNLGCILSFRVSVVDAVASGHVAGRS